MLISISGKVEVLTLTNYLTETIKEFYSRINVHCDEAMPEPAMHLMEMRKSIIIFNNQRSNFMNTIN